MESRLLGEVTDFEPVAGSVHISLNFSFEKKLLKVIGVIWKGHKNLPDLIPTCPKKWNN